MATKLTLAHVKHELGMLGLTCHKTVHGEYRVNFKRGAEATAAYQSDLEDALDTGRAMHRHASKELAKDPVLASVMYNRMTMGQIEAEVKRVASVLDHLESRWQDEKEYEDFADYEKALREALPAWMTMVRMTKRPFGFTYSTPNGRKSTMTVHGNEIRTTVAK